MTKPVLDPGQINATTIVGFGSQILTSFFRHTEDRILLACLKGWGINFIWLVISSFFF